jgi:hypothetical protein
LVEFSEGGMVWSGREFFYGLVSFIDAGDGSPSGVDRVYWTRIGVGVIEMEGERLTTQFALFLRLEVGRQGITL